MDEEIEYLDEVEHDILVYEEEEQDVFEKQQKPKSWSEEAIGILEAKIGEKIRFIGGPSCGKTPRFSSRNDMLRTITLEMKKLGYQFTFEQVKSKAKVLFKQERLANKSETGVDIRTVWSNTVTNMLFFMLKEKLALLNQPNGFPTKSKVYKSIFDKLEELGYSYQFDQVAIKCKSLEKQYKDELNEYTEEGRIRLIDPERCSLWEDVPTRILISLMRHMIPFLGTANFRSKKKVFKIVAKKLSKAGYTFTAQQVESKYKMLRKRKNDNTLLSDEDFIKEFAYVEPPEIENLFIIREDDFESNDETPRRNEPVYESGWNEDSENLFISLLKKILPKVGRSITKKRMFELIAKKMRTNDLPFNMNQLERKYKRYKLKMQAINDDHLLKLLQERPSYSDPESDGDDDLDRENSLWTDAAHRRLLSIIKQFLPLVGNSYGFKSKREMFEEVSNQMQESGYQLSPSQVMVKFRSLEKHYRHLVEYRQGLRLTQPRFSYAKEMEEIDLAEKNAATKPKPMDEEESVSFVEYPPSPLKEEEIAEEDSCRICLEIIVETTPIRIFDVHSPSDETYADMYRRLTGNEVLEMEPQHLCDTCRNKLVAACEFLSFCSKQEEALKDMMAERRREIDECDDRIEEQVVEEQQVQDNAFIIRAESTEEKTEEEIELAEDVKPSSFEGELIFVDELLTCPVEGCNQGFVSLDDKFSHQKQQHGGLRCRLCFMALYGEPDLYIHTLEHHKTSFLAQQHACELCNQLVAASSYETHLLHTHCLDSSHMTALCRDCPTVFLAHETRELHELLEHCSVRCRVCHMAMSPHSIPTHVLRYHKLEGYVIDQVANFDKEYGEGKFWRADEAANSDIPCGICKKTVRDLERHLDCMHSRPQRAYICPECNAVLKNYNALFLHRRKHQPKESTRVECHYCGRSLFDKYQLKKHFGTVHGLLTKWFSCKFCAQNFTSRDVCKDHEGRHEGAPFKYQCSFCPDRFTTKRDLGRHRSTKHLTRTYSCSVCSKNLASQQSLKGHMKGHLKQLDYTCPCCTTKAATNAQMKAHIVKSHPQYQLSKGVSFSQTFRQRVSKHYTLRVKNELAYYEAQENVRIVVK